MGYPRKLGARQNCLVSNNQTPVRSSFVGFPGKVSWLSPLHCQKMAGDVSGEKCKQLAVLRAASFMSFLAQHRGR